MDLKKSNQCIILIVVFIAYFHIIVYSRKDYLSIDCLEIFKPECKQPRRSVRKGTSVWTDKVTEQGCGSTFWV